jgi:hypothetical protein
MPVNNKSRKNKINTCSLALVALPMQHKFFSDNVKNNTDDYLLLVKKLPGCVCFTDKQQLDVLF